MSPYLWSNTRLGVSTQSVSVEAVVQPKLGHVIRGGQRGRALGHHSRHFRSLQQINLAIKKVALAARVIYYSSIWHILKIKWAMIKIYKTVERERYAVLYERIHSIAELTN